MLLVNELEKRIVALGNHEHDADPRAIIASRLDHLQPRKSISLDKFQRTRRKIPNPGGAPIDYNPDLTYYAPAIHDAIDHKDVRTVLMKANTRSGKTIIMEGAELKNLTYGPFVNILHIMQDADALIRYIDERGEENLFLIDEIREKIDFNDRRNSRQRKRIGRALLQYFAATLKALRGVAAPLIIADEIDAYVKKVRDALMTLISSRQEEFGSAAKAILASHPDAGPDGGIDLALKDAMVHLWWLNCPHCHKAMSPAQEAEEKGARLNWNVPKLMGLASTMDRQAFLNFVEREAVLLCPHDACRARFTPAERLDLMRTGRWLQPHQTMMDDGQVDGEDLIEKAMGFVIHGFMAPFQKFSEAARDWAAAMLSYEDTGLDTHIREVTVKKLGETYFGAKDEERIEPWKVVQARLSSDYRQKQVPRGVEFLTAFVDPQGNRLEVRVIGWDRQKRSWLVDAFAIKQWPGVAGQHAAFDDIDPGNRLTDWDVLEHAVLNARYGLQENEQRIAAGQPALFLPVARMAINSAGAPGVTQNARVWLGKMLKRIGQDAMWRIQLFQGAASKTGEEYPKPQLKAFDDAGQKLDPPVYESYPNVHNLKRVIALRMKIEGDHAGAMHTPTNLEDKYIMELTAERFTNGEWVPIRARNETWDGWVACELAREGLRADRVSEDRKTWPWWMVPSAYAHALDKEGSEPVSMFDRLLDVNREAEDR